MGIREIQLEVWDGCVMAGGGGSAGPAPDQRQVTCLQKSKTVYLTLQNATDHEHSWSSGYRQPLGVHKVHGSNSGVMHIFQNVLYAHLVICLVYQRI
jgi:hypothetical protein